MQGETSRGYVRPQVLLRPYDCNQGYTLWPVLRRSGVTPTLFPPGKAQS